jgi:hypothetical protein
MAIATVPPFPVPTVCHVDRVVMPLVHAHAVLDLIHTLASEGGEGPMPLECLRRDTLADAVHSAMKQIEEAINAAEHYYGAEQLPSS